MRGLGRVFLAAFLLALFDARGAGAATIDGNDSAWGVVGRFGYFGLPDVIADKLYRQHPKVNGWAYGGELRYHGDDGRLGIASAGIAVDFCTAEGEGIWQAEDTDAPKAQGGEIRMIAVTMTGYWVALPTWTVHPYIGLGLGVGYFEGKIQDDNELTEVSLLLPVLHVPIGLAVELGERVQLALEARFIDGIQAGGALQVWF